MTDADEVASDIGLKHVVHLRFACPNANAASEHGQPNNSPPIGRSSKAASVGGLYRGDPTAINPTAPLLTTATARTFRYVCRIGGIPAGAEHVGGRKQTRD